MGRDIVAQQVEVFRKTLNDLGYVFFDEGSYNLNIIAVRYLKSNNEFDDFLFLIYKNEHSKWIINQFSVTTEAGKYYLENPMTSRGTFIMCEGQYRGAYKLGFHKGYPALVQAKSIKGFRDNNKDSKHDLDPKTVVDGINYINIHHASSKGVSSSVDRWSAGCIVFANILEWDLFYSIVKKSSFIYGDFFTFTLLDFTDKA